MQCWGRKGTGPLLFPGVGARCYHTQHPGMGPSQRVALCEGQAVGVCVWGERVGPAAGHAQGGGDAAVRAVPAL